MLARRHASSLRRWSHCWRDRCRARRPRRGGRRVSRFGRGAAARRSARSRSSWRRTSGSSCRTTAARPGSGRASAPRRRWRRATRWARPAESAVRPSPRSGWPSSDDIRAAGAARAARWRPRSRPMFFPIRPTRRTCWRSSAAPADAGVAPTRSTNRPTAANVRCHAALPCARGRHSCWRRDRARRSAHHLPRDGDARAAPAARAVRRRRRALDDVRPRAVDRRAHRAHRRGGSRRRERRSTCASSARAASCSRSAATAA